MERTACIPRSAEPSLPVPFGSVVSAPVRTPRPETGPFTPMNLAALRHRIILKRGSDLLRKEQWQKAFSALDRAARLAPRHWESHNGACQREGDVLRAGLGR